MYDRSTATERCPVCLAMARSDAPLRAASVTKPRRSEWPKNDPGSLPTSSAARFTTLATVRPVSARFRNSPVSYLQFLQSIEKAIAVRTLESLARIELGAQGGALLERVTTTRISKSGVATTTVRERFTAPDWHADGWFGLVSADGARPARPRSGEGG